MPISSRRDFIKKNVFGSLFCFSAIPLMPLHSLLSEEESMVQPLISSQDYSSIDWKEVRKQFSLSSEKYYFNTASLGPSPKVVIDKICSMLNQLGEGATEGLHLLAEPHEKLAKFLNAEVEEIGITRNTTEGMNIAARSLPLKKGDEILLTKHEHIGGSAPWLALQKDIGVQVRLIELDPTGKNNLQLIKENISEKTKVVSFSHITCTTGMILPAEEIVRFCRSKEIYTCIDGAQAVGMIPVNLKEINPDFYACGGHKWLFGPKGTGILYINKSVIAECNPTFVGAYTDSQFDLNSLTLEYRLHAQRVEYGTRNTPMTVALGTAIDFIESIGIENIMARGRSMSLYVRKALEAIPAIEILSPADSAYFAALLTVRVKGVDNSTLVKSLRQDEKDIRLRFIYENNINGIRLSLSIFNSKEEIDYLVAALNKAIIK